MIKIQLKSNIKTLNDCLNLANTKKESPIAFLSTKLSIADFYNFSSLDENDLIFDYTDKIEKKKYLDASISANLKSKLLIDFKDKSLYRQGNKLSISDIRQMIIPLKYKQSVKTIYIDNFDSVSCELNDEDHIKHEYKMAQLYYMSHKFELDFIIGKELNKNTSNPLKVSDIKFMNFGNSYDMVDKIIVYNNGTERILK